MMQASLLYWFPGRIEPAPAYAARFRDPAGQERGCFSRSSQGPETGVRGCLASPMHDVCVVYQPHAQRWDRLSPDTWIGAAKEKASPERFARPRQYNGYRRTLGDGHEWLIPVANPFARLCSLPAHDVLRDGAWVREVDENYRALSERAAELSAEVRIAVLERREEIDCAPSDADMRNLMANILALNYDLTIEEMSALRLFDPSMYWSVVSAFIDWEETRSSLLRLMEGGQAAAPFGGFAPQDTSATSPTASMAGGTA